MRRLWGAVLVVAALAVAAAPAGAQSGPTPRQLQTEIDNGQEGAALGALRPVLRAHPDSAVAWYLVAEAEDASGNKAAARDALAKADQYAPGLPFAQPDKVAALRAHLAGPAAPAARGISPVLLGLGGLVVLFLVIRLFLRSRRAMPVYQDGYRTAPPAGPYPYQGGGLPYGGMGGGGLGSSLMTGLAAGAGLAAGERIIDNLGGGFTQGNDAPQQPVPDRDDGLSGSPDWGGGGGGNTDDNQGGGDFDPGNGW